MLIRFFPAVICRLNHSKLELVVRVRSFFSLPDSGPKTWWQRRTLSTKVVDINSFELLQLVDFIAEHCLWGFKQYITLWRDLENDSMKIKSNENLLEWFLINVEDGLVCINAQINDFEGPLQFSPIKRRFHPTVRASVLLIALLSNFIYLIQLFIFTCTNNSSNEHLVQVQVLV